MRGITQESEERIARIKSEYEKSLDEKDEVTLISYKY